MQVYTAIDSSKARRASSQLGEVVVVHLGNNGTLTDEQFYELMELLAGVDRVGSVNVKIPCVAMAQVQRGIPTPRSSTGTRRA